MRAAAFGNMPNGKRPTDSSKENSGGEKRPPPMQLPIVLQVLLSTDHRLRALQLLARFMDKGAWAVNLSLSVGIFPYVLKLLQSPSRELREVLVFIWAKILALDRSVAGDLSKVDYCSYFVQHLLKYQAPTGGAMAAAMSGGAHKYSGLHSRSSSVAASPIIRPGQLSLSSTPASTPFHSGFSTTFGSNGSGPPSAVATPHLGEGVQPSQQYPFKPLQLNTSPTLRSTLPPLDLPPADLSDGTSATHSMQLRDHPLPVAHAHLGVNAQAFAQMRAQPLHDPAVRLPEDYVPPIDPMLLLATAAGDPPTDDSIIGLPPVHPQLQQSPSMQPRVPFPLDLSAPQSSISPIQSPSQPAGGASLNTSKSSPVLSALASFSPTSPMLSPIMRSADGTFERQSRFDVSPQHHDSSAHQAKDGGGLQDAHDLTRVARELLLTTDLQHLLSLFILSCIAYSNPKGQQTLMQSGLSSFRELISPTLLFAPDVRLRKWTCFAVGQCWRGFGHAKTVGASEGVPEALVQKLMDPQPSVRAAALWALGTFFGGKIMMNQQTAGQAMSPTQSARAHALKSQQRLELELHLGVAMSTLINDGSPTVRRELMLSLAELVYFQQDLFLAIATAHPRNRESISTPGWHIWRAILRGCRDCSHLVQEVALAIKGYLKARAILNQSQLGRMIGSQHNPGLHLLHRDLTSGSSAGVAASTYPIEEDEMGPEGMDGPAHTEGRADGAGSRKGSVESRNTVASSTDRRPSTSSSRSRTSDI